MAAEGGVSSVRSFVSFLSTADTSLPAAGMSGLLGFRAIGCFLLCVRIRAEDEVAGDDNQHDGNHGAEGDASGDRRTDLIDAQGQAVADHHLIAKGNPAPLAAALLPECRGNGDHAGCIEDVEEKEAHADQLAAAEHGADSRCHIGLDYFDAAINRIGAYVIGTRATQKCVLSALLEPLAKLREYEDTGRGFQRLALLEEAKTLPFGAVFDYFNYKNGVPVGEEFIPAIEKYEKDVTSKR